MLRLTTTSESPASSSSLEAAPHLASTAHTRPTSLPSVRFALRLHFCASSSSRAPPPAEVGLERYKLPFLVHFIVEVMRHGHIPRCRNSLSGFWIHTLRCPQVRFTRLPLQASPSGSRKRGAGGGCVPRRMEELAQRRTAALADWPRRALTSPSPSPHSPLPSPCTHRHPLNSPTHPPNAHWRDSAQGTAREHRPPSRRAPPRACRTPFPPPRPTR